VIFNLERVTFQVPTLSRDALDQVMNAEGGSEQAQRGGTASSRAGSRAARVSSCGGQWVAPPLAHRLPELRSARAATARN